MRHYVFLSLIGWLLTACSSVSMLGLGGEDKEISLEARLNTAKTIIDERAQKGRKFEPIEFKTRYYNLFGFQHISDASAPLMIYIEGDGLTRSSAGALSENPTPIDPLALRLASLDQSPNILWLARPCHYSLDPSEALKAGAMPDNCNTLVWSSAKYSEAVIASFEQAINEVLIHEGIKGAHLVGYDGGGAVAVLLAPRLKQVISLRTLAGDIDPFALARHRNQIALSGSLNPTDKASALKGLPQFHFVGEDDEIIPAWVAIRFIAEYVGKTCSKALLIEDIDHQEGWPEYWKQAHKTLPTCQN